MRLAFTHVCGRVYKQFVYHLKIASTMKRILCVVETIQSTGIRQKLRTSSQTRDEFELLLAQRHQIDILQISLLNNSINRIEHLVWRRAYPQNHHFSSIEHFIIADQVGSGGGSRVALNFLSPKEDHI